MKKLLISLTVLLQSVFLLSQNTPLEIAQLIFSEQPPKDLEPFSTGEYKLNLSVPSGKDLDKKIQRTFSMLEENEQTAVVRMTLIENSSEKCDIYLHFQKEEQQWKIEAYRGLAMTGLLKQVLATLDSLTPAQMDSLCEAEKKEEPFTSKASIEAFKFNLKLTLSLDDELIAYFNQNKAQFEQLRTQIVAKKAFADKDTTHPDYKRRILLFNYGHYFDNEMKSLGLRLATTVTDSCHECIDFLIGGMLENMVGYLYVPDTSLLPKMTPNRYIMVRAIGDNWFLFKTT
jgi:hypothetical protein